MKIDPTSDSVLKTDFYTFRSLITKIKMNIGMHIYIPSVIDIFKVWLSFLSKASSKSAIDIFKVWLSFLSKASSKSANISHTNLWCQGWIRRQNTCDRYINVCRSITYWRNYTIENTHNSIDIVSVLTLDEKVTWLVAFYSECVTCRVGSLLWFQIYHFVGDRQNSCLTISTRTSSFQQ